MSDSDSPIGVVTGAAQGLGLAIAEQLARDGVTVFMADRQFGKTRKEADRLGREGLNVYASSLDISNSEHVSTFFRELSAQYGRLDILVNNAGIGQSVTPIDELDDEEWNRVLDITLTGTFHCCRAAASIMERQESGCIVNVASINGQNPSPFVAAYNVAKAGVISLTRTLALELAAYGVRVNAISPGPVYTEFNKRVMDQRSERMGISSEQMVENVRKAIPLGRWGVPEDIARAVAFLCSPSAAWITGEVLTVSGGLSGVGSAAPKRSIR